MYRENKNMILVFKNKEATQVERPQRFIDAEAEKLGSISKRKEND